MSENHNIVDISHHFSEFGRRLGNFRGVRGIHPPGVISFDSGNPDVEYYPIKSISVEYLEPSAFSLEPTGTLPDVESSTAQFVIPRRLQKGDQTKFELKNALSYSSIAGIPAVETFSREWIAKIHKPAYNDWKTLINEGSAGAWASCLSIFLDPGDSYFTDYYSYNVVLTQARAMGMVPVAIATDMEGMSAIDLERVLESWDEKSRGSKRPRLIYTQGGVTNPTGQLTTAQRKKEIYAVAVRYDLIIIEDDPYYFQQAPYRGGETQTNETKTDEEWLEELVPSYLQFDYQGRVIRLDTFSKSIAPGARLGYYTGPTLVIERLIAQRNIFSSFPSGFAQAIVGELLYRYEMDGFIRWLRGLSAQYALRRNWVIDTIQSVLHVEPKNDSSRTLTVYAPRDSQTIGLTRTSLMSFVPPAGGMLFWFNIHLYNHPRYKELRDRKSIAAAKNQLATELWSAIANSGVMVRRGELCAVEGDEERAERGEEGSFLRVSFCDGTKDNLQKGLTIFATELVKFFE